MPESNKHIISHWEIANQITMRYYFTPAGMGKLKIQLVISVDKDVKKLESLYNPDENIKRSSQF